MQDLAKYAGKNTLNPFVCESSFDKISFSFQFFLWKNFRHVEHWNVPKMALLKQILRPTRDWLWFKKAGGT